MENNNLRFIIIDNPYDQMSDPIVQSLLPKIFDLRIRGYRSRYEYGVLPLDANDFIGTHLAVARQIKNEYIPIMCCKMITLSRTKKFNVPFPALSIMQQYATEKHVQVVKEILQNCEAQNKDIVFIGSFTIDPNEKADKDLNQVLCHLCLVLQYYYMTQHQISEGITGTTVRFKTIRLSEILGYRPLKFGDEQLPPVTIPTIKNESSLFQHLSAFPNEMRKLAASYEPLWKNALYLPAQDKKTTMQAA